MCESNSPAELPSVSRQLTVYGGYVASRTLPGSDSSSAELSIERIENFLAELIHEGCYRQAPTQIRRGDLQYKGS